MSKQFTVITKDGSKWLRPVLNPSDTDQLSRFFQNAGDGFEDLPYIGTRPEGTILDESEVKGVRQGFCEYTMKWITEYDDDLPTYNRYRTVYTDAESHSHHISEDYWRKRCEAAERYIQELHVLQKDIRAMCDDSVVAEEEWQEIVKQQPK